MRDTGTEESSPQVRETPQEVPNREQRSELKEVQLEPNKRIEVDSCNKYVKGSGVEGVTERESRVGHKGSGRLVKVNNLNEVGPWTSRCLVDGSS